MNYKPYHKNQGFLRHFRDRIRVPRTRENYDRVPKIRKNRAPRIREIGSLQIQTRFLTFSLKKTCKNKLNTCKINLIWFGLN